MIFGLFSPRVNPVLGREKDIDHHTEISLGERGSGSEWFVVGG